MKINIYILTGLMASCSIILGVIENFIPTPVPAIRLGLANVPIIIMLYLAGSKYAFQVSFLKALLPTITLPLHLEGFTEYSSATTFIFSAAFCNSSCVLTLL